MSKKDKAEVTEVYILEDISGRRNTYGIDRNETWTQRLDKCFENREDALEYVKEKTRKLPVYKELCYGQSRDRCEDFLETFITSECYIHHNRYFIGLVPFNSIRRALENDGITVIDERK